MPCWKLPKFKGTRPSAWRFWSYKLTVSMLNSVPWWKCNEIHTPASEATLGWGVQIPLQYSLCEQTRVFGHRPGSRALLPCPSKLLLLLGTCPGSCHGAWISCRPHRSTSWKGVSSARIRKSCKKKLSKTLRSSDGKKFRNSLAAQSSHRLAQQSTSVRSKTANACFTKLTFDEKACYMCLHMTKTISPLATFTHITSQLIASHLSPSTCCRLTPQKPRTAQTKNFPSSKSRGFRQCFAVSHFVLLAPWQPWTFTHRGEIQTPRGLKGLTYPCQSQQSSQLLAIDQCWWQSRLWKPRASPSFL